MSEFFYKIRHIESGKFYQPVKGRSYEKTNLGPSGKVYHKKPTLLHLKHGYSVVVSDENSRKGKKSVFKEFNKKDWEIVKYKIVEVGVL